MNIEDIPEDQAPRLWDGDLSEAELAEMQRSDQEA